jgi:hypothetical protein
VQCAVCLVCAVLPVCVDVLGHANWQLPAN